MNAQIQMLFKQAGGHVEVDSDGNYFTYTQDFDPEYFAHLILSGCLSICEDMGDKGKDGHYCADEINRKFG